MQIVSSAHATSCAARDSPSSQRRTWRRRSLRQARLLCRASLSALEASLQLAAIRAAEVHRIPAPRFLDPFSEALAGPAELRAAPSGDAADADAVATAYIDEQLLTAVDIVNMDLRQEYRQVVLLGCGMDTRPFRLPWPPGTVLFLLAPAEVHAAAAAALRTAGAAVPRGCLLRRVPIHLAGEMADFGVALEAAGYRGDRLSVWALQGLAHLGLQPQQLAELLAHASNMAALQSLFLGQLPPATAADAAGWLAQAGLLGSLLPAEASFGSGAALKAASPAEAAVGSGMAAAAVAAGGRESSDEAVLPRLFSAQQQRLSLPQMRVYNDHVLASEELDEDFEGNFS